MRICYLPIFLALASSLNPGCTAEHVRVSRQTLLGPLLELNIPGLLTSVLSMVMPSELSSVLSENVEEVFSKVPLDLSMIGRLTSLDLLKGLGRKKRFVRGNPNKENQQKTIGNDKTKSDVESNRLIEDTIGSFGLMEPYPTELVKKMFSKHFGIESIYAKRTTDRKRRSNDEEGADAQTKATETMMSGTTMMKKGLEGSKMAAEAGSDLAQSGKAGAEGLASGADMMGGAAETMAAGAGQIQSMIPG